MKITFKKEPRPTGLQAVGAPYPTTQVKVDGKICGQIIAPTWRRAKWGIVLAIKKPTPDNNPNCDWKNIVLKSTFDTEPAARAYIRLVLPELAKKFTLHFYLE